MSNAIIPHYEQYVHYLQERLTPARLQHSIEVMHMVAVLAPIYNLDCTAAMTAGLLHDAAHDLTDEALVELAKEAGLRLEHPADSHPVYLHGPVGAYVVERDLGVRQAVVLDAIYTHSYMSNGSDRHSHFAWCLRCADILAPSRTFEDLKQAVRIPVMAGQIYTAAGAIVQWVLDNFPEIGIPVHPQVLEMKAEVNRRASGEV